MKLKDLYNAIQIDFQRFEILDNKTDSHGYPLDWNEQEQIWHDAGYDFTCTDAELDELTVVEVHPYGACALCVRLVR